VAKIKVPGHNGPDGQGLPQPVFDKLIELLSSKEMTQEEIIFAIELCFGASKTQEWNEAYKPELIKLLKEKYDN
jgi:hypothetical protein